MDRVQSTSTVEPSGFATGKCLKALLSSRQRGKGSGQTTVEFALICLPFFIILFAIIDFSEIFFYDNSLQNAMREACRFATSGRVIQTTNANGTPAYVTNTGGIVVPKAINDANGQEASRNECIRYWFLTNCALKSFPLSNIGISNAPYLAGVQPVVVTNFVAGQGYLVLKCSNGADAIKGPGGANDYVQITATYQVSTITPLMGYMNGYTGISKTFPVHVSAIVKNEPAILNFQHNAMYSNEP